MRKALFTVVFTVFAFSVYAADATPKMYSPIEDPNKIVVMMDLLNPAKGNTPIGKVIITESKYGLVFTPMIENLEPGVHGFHIHANPDCGANEQGAAGMKAGGHWDPMAKGAHSYPWFDEGHLGDLPALYVDKGGKAETPVLAPKLKKLSEVKDHALMIHVGGDNHHDTPAALGGGGARFACGVIK